MPTTVPHRSNRNRRPSHAPLSARRSENVELAVNIVHSPLGVMMVAATLRGIRFLAFGDDEHVLERELFDAFPGVSITPPTAQLKRYSTAVLRQLTVTDASIELPLDTTGTPFQECIWAELRRIPCGERCSYQDLAKRVGQPKAVRAVARACASNCVAVLIPCHRVVRSDGALGGYRWGVKRKQALLDAEAVGR
jgi:AraC family transcriptional regulator of adaptative response/methylated-DNA-[protein]-cysteine methyltransferase